MALATLGYFVFELKTAPFATVNRQTDHRWRMQDRAGAAPAAQYLGPGEDTLTIDGTLYPELTGGPVHLDRLRTMASSGKAWILLDGQGRNQGQWFIMSVNETRSYLLGNGLARKIDFSLSLSRYWDAAPSALGSLSDSRP